VEVDLLGPPYESQTLELGSDDEGPVVATLVRRRADLPAPSRRAVLWVHGLADYFFQTHVADFFTDLGYDFYALDLRKHGRSLRPYQTPAFCRSVAEYVPELDTAARIIRDDHGHDTLVVAAHSTGGLISALWAHRRRAAHLVDGLFLNSPFFDFNVPWLMRRPVAEAAARLGRRQPYGVLRLGYFPVYGHSLHRDFRGEWSYILAWKPVGGFPIRLGWLAAITAAHRRLHRGLSIDAPVLVGCSTRSYRSAQWHEAARRADAVLNVGDIVRWAPYLGRHVTLVRIDGGVHDLTLSAPGPRAALFAELATWLEAYVKPAAAAPEPAVASRAADPAPTPAGTGRRIDLV